MKIGKAKLKKILKETERILLDKGFKRTNDLNKYLLFEWIYQSKEHGNFYLRIDNDSDSHVFSVFGRFTDVDKVKNRINCNPYSGKHNLHITNQHKVTYEDIILKFDEYINQIISVLS